MVEPILDPNLVFFAFGVIIVESGLILWIYYGESNYHVVCDEPLAGKGYNPFWDNVFKCAVLFWFDFIAFLALATWGNPIPFDRVHWLMPLFAIAFVSTICIYLIREATAWIS
jgi:hypothetical protein